MSAGGWLIMNGDWDHDDLKRLEDRVVDIEREVHEMRGSAKTWQVILAIVGSTFLNIAASWMISHQDADTARAIQRYIEQHDEGEKHMETNR